MEMWEAVCGGFHNTFKSLTSSQAIHIYILKCSWSYYQYFIFLLQPHTRSLRHKTAHFQCIVWTAKEVITTQYSKDEP